MLKGVLKAGVLIFLGAVMTANADSPPADGKVAARALLGNWLVEKKDGIIAITEAADGTLTGTIVGGSRPTDRDEHNPDPALRSRLLKGSVIIQGMHFDGGQTWSGGSIYDPGNGSSYHCTMELLASGDLKVRGYIGVPLLGRSQVWTRYRGTQMDIPPPTH